MTNTELIAALRCNGTTCHDECPYSNGREWCDEDRMIKDAADALEAADKRIDGLLKLVDINTDRCEALRKQLRESNESYEQRIAELEEQNELKDGTITAMATDIGKLRAAVDNYEKIIAELSAQIPKWISEEDHLPEESGEYIVYIQMGTGVEVPDFLGSNDLSYVTSMYFKERQKLWLDEYDEAYNADLSLVDTENDYHVTHWMPLPQNPKGEQDGEQ